MPTSFETAQPRDFNTKEDSWINFRTFAAYFNLLDETF